jgi:predicted enzyme related to lactoylglutathione lyase
MGAPVVHWEINARDAKRVQEFYSNLFGWKVDANNPMNYGLVNTGSKGSPNGGIAQADENNPTPSVTFYVGVNDLQRYLDKAESLGGRTVVPPTEIPGMVTLAMLADPEGNTIGIVKETQPAPKKKPARKKKTKKTTRKTKRAKGKKARRRR